MASKIKNYVKHGIVLILSLSVSVLALRIISKVPFIHELANNNLRFMVGLLLGMLSFWLVFFLSVYFWRRLFVFFGMMTIQEFRLHPFSLGSNPKNRGK